MGQVMYQWNVDKVHTNTQCLLVELGRDRLIRDSDKQGCTKKSQGNIKLNPLRLQIQLLYSNVPLHYIISVYICNDSASKLIMLFESSTLKVH